MERLLQGKSRIPRSLAETAWLEIREQILTGELPPGSPVAIKETAERLGMSMMPVREAVRQLRQEGLVIQETHKEPMVATLSVSDMEDIYRVRVALESLAIELAAERITESSYQELCRLLDEFQAAYEQGDIRRGRDLHRDFHVNLCSLSDSVILNRLIPPLIDSSERYRVLSVKFRGSAETRRQEHQVILDACYAGDRDVIREVVQRHLERTVEIVRDALQENL